MKQFFQKIAEFFREVQSELKKVTYPSWPETLGSTAVVIIFVLIVGVFLTLVDLVLVRAISLVIE
ncbi:MAG TPA: preprotein translocase subunit SecE [Nitrospiria bacterium]|nr:preprotein translocase subunit SecE [Nitrospiria bacterium]